MAGFVDPLCTIPVTIRGSSLKALVDTAANQSMHTKRSECCEAEFTHELHVKNAKHAFLCPSHSLPHTSFTSSNSCVCATSHTALWHPCRMASLSYGISGASAPWRVPRRRPKPVVRVLAGNLMDCSAIVQLPAISACNTSVKCT